MGRLILPDNYRFRIVNQMGATIEFSADSANNTFTISGMSWKFDTDGALLYSTEFTVFADPSADLTDTSAAEGAIIDNAVSNGGIDFALGLNCVATLVTDCANAGRLEIYLEHETDGGAGSDWPSDAADLVESEDLIFIRSIIHPGGGAGAPDTKRVNFSI